MKKKLFWLFTTPSNLMMIALMLIPMLMSIWLSFHFVTYRNITEPEFIGLRNYAELLQDPRFWESFKFTITLVLIVVPLQMLIGFVMALLLDQVSKAVRGIFLAMMLLPYIVVPVVGTLMFKQLFVPSGLISWAYQQITGTRFLFTESSVKTLIFLHTIWSVTPYPLVVFFSGLQTLPEELVEAASIDGANRLQQIRYIVVPHLRSLIIMVALIDIMDMYRIFDNVFVLTQMNPIYHAFTVMVYNFQVAMTVQRLGKGNAMSVLTVIVILVVLLPFLYLTYREQTEER